MKKYFILMYTCMLFETYTHATKIADHDQFLKNFTTKNFSELSKTINTSILLDPKIPQSWAGDQVAYNVVFKNKNLTWDEKKKIIKLLLAKAPSEEQKNLLQFMNFVAGSESDHAKHPERYKAANIISKETEYLFHAAQSGNLPAVQLLIEHGADPNQGTVNIAAGTSNKVLPSCCARTSPVPAPASRRLKPCRICPTAISSKPFCSAAIVS